MRITIDIDEQGARVALAPPSGGDQNPPDMTPAAAPDANAGAAQAGPSADLAARAARLGATSAGPAPSGPPDVAGAPGLAPAGLDAQSTGRADTSPDPSVDVSAGPAPTAG